MKKTSYLLFIAAAGFVLSACEEKKEYFELGTLDGIGMVVRSVSIEDGITTRPIDVVTVDYNNLIGLNENKPATVNGNAVNAYVNPANHMQLVIPVNSDWNNTYNVVVPDGFVYRSDDPSVTNEGLSVSFNTNLGLNPNTVEKNLTNPNATSEVKALYQELLNNYGKVMYSGAMGGVGWETGYSDYIAANDGGAGYPKIVGFDYLHLAYSPANWIDYGDITPVKSVWDAGSIPAITWHWNVPEIDEDGNVVDGTLSFNGSFSPLKALTQGTPQHEIVEADIAKLAGYMKLLQDANIPVLFRPLHEAAGDYTYGAWFWWGNDGVDATKKLWNYLRDKLENEYGLNNIIWVWTMQTSNAGQPADVSLIRSAYPGDDAVDMVGTDLYPDNALTDQAEQFYLVNSAAGGKKMVALCEVGNLIDPNAALYNNALWSYFMNWYDYASEGVFGFNEWNTQAVSLDGKDYPNPWAAVANNPFVVNR